MFSYIRLFVSRSSRHKKCGCYGTQLASCVVGVMCHGGSASGPCGRVRRMVGGPQPVLWDFSVITLPLYIETVRMRWINFQKSCQYGQTLQNKVWPISADDSMTIHNIIPILEEQESIFWWTKTELWAVFRSSVMTPKRINCVPLTSRYRLVHPTKVCLRSRHRLSV